LIRSSSTKKSKLIKVIFCFVTFIGYNEFNEYKSIFTHLKQALKLTPTPVAYEILTKIATIRGCAEEHLDAFDILNADFSDGKTISKEDYIISQNMIEISNTTYIDDQINITEKDTQEFRYNYLPKNIRRGKKGQQWMCSIYQLNQWMNKTLYESMKNENLKEDDSEQIIDTINSCISGET
jgi:hypothetical protein